MDTVALKDRMIFSYFFFIFFFIVKVISNSARYF